MAKCILLVRVSTESKKQEISLREQETELFELALSKGYCEEDIIAICKQESALKRRYATSDEKDAIEIKQQGLQEMEDAIKNDSSINCVFAWEISRISRREKVLFDELEFLTDRKIQLVILKPRIEYTSLEFAFNDNFKSISDFEYVSDTVPPVQLPSLKLLFLMKYSVSTSFAISKGSLILVLLNLNLILYFSNPSFNKSSFVLSKKI